MRAVANNFLGEIWDDVRDCLALHYKLNRKLDAPFWKICQKGLELGIGEDLLEFYRENGSYPFGANLIRTLAMPPQAQR